jgi:integrase
VGHKDADELFVAYRKSLFTEPAPTEAPNSDISCWELCDRYLVWAQENLAAKNYGCKKSCLNQWCDHPIANSELPGYGGVIGDVPALEITALHLDDFLTTRKKAIGTAGKNKGRRISDVMLSHNMVHVKACWNWAADHRRGNLLPKDLRPFAGLAKIRIAAKPKSEFELPTEEEFQALLEHADADFGKVRGANGRYRRRTPKEYRTGSANPYRGFADIVRFCYAAGPRTSKIASLRVQDVHLRTCQVTLGKHKRTTTMNNTTVRDIQLNDEALAICKKHCKGRKPRDYVFTQSNGAPWNQDRLDERFRMIRTLAEVRDEITIYSFRHLWICDMMEDAEIPVGTIASMAGTSIDQIERTYGHFRNRMKAKAQARLDQRRAKRRKSSVA